MAQLELKETEGNKVRHTKFKEEPIRREGDCKGKVGASLFSWAPGRR